MTKHKINTYDKAYIKPYLERMYFMCGIIGVASKKEQAIPMILQGLKTLEYRGYDSSGIAYFKENQIVITKTKGRISDLEQQINFKDASSLGIGHTRWATHGEANQVNAHPHQVGKITIVHNGIIENYQELKAKLQENGYSFLSSTDTEVACALLDFYYEKTNSVTQAIQAFIHEAKGSYAIGLLCQEEPDTLYAIKKDSPLIVAASNDTNFIASDIPAVLEYTSSYYVLEDEEYAILTKDHITFYDKEGKALTKEEKHYDASLESPSKGSYPHYMIKEMMEQPDTIWKTMQPFLENGLASLAKLPDLTKYDRIDIVACGTAWHAGLVGKYFLEEYAAIPVDVCLASEYRYKRLFLSPKVLVIFISQSGETADTLAALKRVKEEDCHTLGIINVKDSSIARVVDQVIYTKAGCEIAVASTKAFTAQVAILLLLALQAAYQKNLMEEKQVLAVIEEFKHLKDHLTPLLAKRSEYQKIAKELYKQEDIFYLGRGLDYDLMMEGALKLKEISYIPSVCYAAGELKHGTISLVQEGTRVIASCTNPLLDPKTMSNLKETKARGAKIYLITNNVELTKDKDIDSVFLLDQTSEFLVPFLVIIPLQFLAYEIALLRQCDIDKPRNLAKAVTVE